MKHKKPEYKRAGNLTFKEVVKLIRIMRKEYERLGIEPYTPRKDGRIL